MTASKLEVGKFEINPEISSINSLIKSVYNYNLVLAQKKNLNFKLSLDENISFLNIDKMRIEQVLNNFISNAIKFTPEKGTIKISSKLIKRINELSGKEEILARVSVKDTGVGISPEEQSKVFNKYEQTEAGKDASLKGTGLGLAIAKEIIQLHKGEVGVESVEGKGSVFYFDLPISQLKI